MLKYSSWKYSEANHTTIVEGLQNGQFCNQLFANEQVSWSKGSKYFNIAKAQPREYLNQTNNAGEPQRQIVFKKLSASVSHADWCFETSRCKWWKLSLWQPVSLKYCRSERLCGKPWSELKILLSEYCFAVSWSSWALTLLPSCCLYAKTILMAETWLNQANSIRIPMPLRSC